MISIFLTILLSLASKVFGALLIIIRLFIKLLIILFKAQLNLIKNLIEKIRNRGGTKCQKN